ncbi:MAG: hypothetical protein Q8N26_02565 [Myxococcales bacterium]|nr:hypothetical protein [Myxococcales bacterium]
MKSALPLVFALVFVGCKPRENEAGLVAVVTLEAGLVSKCMLLEVGAGGTRLISDPVLLTGKTIIYAGIAQGTFPAQVDVRALGFSDEECRVRAREESSLVSATFDKTMVQQVPLTLKKVAPKTETDCSDGLDDDLDGQLDCGDSDCDDQPCTSTAACLVSTRCSNGTCGGGQIRQCLSPPTTCFQPMGMCAATDGGCQYTVATNAMCSDGDSCTLMDRCELDGSCRGTQRACAQSGNVCLEDTGACADGGCTFAPKPDAGCDDADSCTVADRCTAAGTCAGERVSCVAPACRVVAPRCNADGGCIFEAVDAGTTCDGGLCSIAGDCLPRFPYQPTNFDVVQVRAPPMTPTVLDCGETTIDTSGTGLPRTTNWCGNQVFEASIIKQDGGLDAVLVSMSGLTIGSDAGLTITGNKPVIFAVFGDVSITGQVVSKSGAALCTSSAGRDGTSLGLTHAGGSGAGFSTAGGVGGSGASGVINGPAGGDVEPNLSASPLRGGCSGGRGGNQSAAAAPGGGAVQISAAGTMAINGRIAAPGEGGSGGRAGAAGNGGGSGGLVVLEALELTISGGAITANGGGGGEGGALTEGNPGDDGRIDAAVGAPGGSGGPLIGGNGGTGGFTSAPTGGETNTNGGGGGGSSGRLFFRGAANCSIGPQVILSPLPALDAGCP